MRQVYDVIDKRTGRTLIQCETCYRVCCVLNITRSEFIDALDRGSDRYDIRETDLQYDDSCASRLKYLMVKHNLTNNQAAAELGINPLTLCNWLYYGRYPSALNLVNLADLFHTSIDFIMGRVDSD